MDSICRVLHVFGRMNRGGAEMRTIEVMRHLQGKNIEHHFCVLSGLTGVLDDEIRSLGGHVHYVKLNSSFLLRFIKLLRQWDFDVVHSHVQNFSGAILVLAAFVNVPKRIAHFRNTNSDHQLTVLKRIQYCGMRILIDRYATNILAVCIGAMEVGWRTTWQNDPRCKVVYNGFDPETYRIQYESSDVFSEFHIPITSRLLIHVGRMDPAKNHLRLAHIFALLAGQYSDVHLLLVGLGGNDIENELHEFFMQEQVEERVTFAGLRNDIPRLLAAADLMIFPSIWEGLPGAVIEARLTGLPVVASDLPGVREIAAVMNGVTILSLEKDNAEWVHICSSILYNSSKNRPDIAQTPFAISYCAQQLHGIWTVNANT